MRPRPSARGLWPLPPRRPLPPSSRAPGRPSPLRPGARHRMQHPTAIGRAAAHTGLLRHGAGAAGRAAWRRPYACPQHPISPTQFVLRRADGCCPNTRCCMLHVASLVKVMHAVCLPLVFLRLPRACPAAVGIHPAQQTHTNQAATNEVWSRQPRQPTLGLPPFCAFLFQPTSSPLQPHTLHPRPPLFLRCGIPWGPAAAIHS